MGLIEKNTRIGTLYISTKNFKMALKQEDTVISDQEGVWSILDKNRIPVKVQFEITERCNFNCYYCYAKSIRNRKDLSTDEIKTIIDKLDEIGVVFLDITGGEPLARKDFLEILKYINSKNFVISMITNGSLMTEEIVEELTKSNLYVIRLSILAPTETVCDDLTNTKNSFNRTLTAAKLLKKNNLRFYISSVLTKKNINLCEEYNKLQEELGMKIAFGVDVGPSFTGYSDVEEYGLTYEDVENLKLFFPDGYNPSKIELVCSGATTKFAIDNQGNIMPCLKIRNNLGNILKKPFLEIWENEKIKNIIKDDLSYDPKCLKCDKRNYCSSYCPGEHKLFESDKMRCKSAHIISKLINCN